MPAGEAQKIARAMLPSYGWSPSSQFGCLVNLWNKESHWNTHAANPSGAYGIPQALPGSKMASAGPDWQNNARTQIKWGLGYIKSRYGAPCDAWAPLPVHRLVLIVVATPRGSSVPKSVAVVAGLGVVMGLAVAAPGRAASPSTPASQIVGSHHHKKAGPAGKHRTVRPKRDSTR